MCILMASTRVLDFIDNMGLSLYAVYIDIDIHIYIYIYNTYIIHIYIYTYVYKWSRHQC